MGKDRPMVPLGEVLSKSDEWIELRPDQQYKQVTVKLWGQGVVLRNTLSGNEIAATKRLCIHAGQFILSRIDARNGAFGLVPDALDDAIVSNDFPTFVLNTARIMPKYLEWMSKTQVFIDLCNTASEGTTNRVRLKEDRFLTMEIPLPQLEEQQRIVARIEELIHEVDQASRFNQQSVIANEALFASAVNSIWKNEDNWLVRSIAEIVTIISGQVNPEIEPYASMPHINGECIKSGTCQLLSYRSAKDDGVRSGKYYFKKGSVLYSKIRPNLKKAICVPFEGICSADIYAFDSINSDIEPRFFMYSLISPRFTEYANSLSGRTRMPKLNQKQLLAFQMSYPPLAEQRRIVAYLDELQAKVNELKKLQTKTQKEVGALLSSILNKAFSGEL